MKCILLVDDHQILMDGILELLEKTGLYQVIGTANTAQQALDFLKVNSDSTDVVITDIGLPDMRGNILAAKIRSQYPELKIVALSMHEEQHIIKDTIKAGVDGYVLKRSTHDDLVIALEAVLKGENYVSPSITHMLMEDLRSPSVVELLSDREKEIIRLVTQEKTTKKIAEELFISEKTVEAHKTNIFRKTDTATLVGLTKFAIEHNLV
jgi:DNA-binding NarL/FixJ family response regulator